MSKKTIRVIEDIDKGVIFEKEEDIEEEAEEETEEETKDIEEEEE